MNPAVAILTTLVRAYRTLISPMFPPSCRFVPTCSQYALDAITTHGAIKGTWLAMRRISRCHPLHPGGFDPVPGTEPHSPHDHDS